MKSNEEFFGAEKEVACYEATGLCLCNNWMADKKSWQRLVTTSHLFQKRKWCLYSVLIAGNGTIERKKPKRTEALHIVHENGYREMDGEELRAMFGQKTGEQSYDAYMDAFCSRKYNSDFSREMTRSVNVYLKDFLEL